MLNVSTGLSAWLRSDPSRRSPGCRFPLCWHVTLQTSDKDAIPAPMVISSKPQLNPSWGDQKHLKNCAETSVVYSVPWCLIMSHDVRCTPSNPCRLQRPSQGQTKKRNPPRFRLVMLVVRASPPIFCKNSRGMQKTRISGFLRNCLWGTLARHTLELSLSFGANLIDWQRVYRILYTVYHLNVGLHWSQTQANFSPAETSAYASAS